MCRPSLREHFQSMRVVLPSTGILQSGIKLLLERKKKHLTVNSSPTHPPVAMLKLEIVFLIILHHPNIEWWGRGNDTGLQKALILLILLKGAFHSLSIKKNWHFKKAVFRSFGNNFVYQDYSIMSWRNTSNTK